MKCYNCGCQLSEKDFCTGCGADVALYKKIMYASNFFYNEGLEKAGVRDLSGAVISLRQSLKFNKNNVEARNLLGLVYYEMGEVVPALSEWVISKNLRSKKNIADDYLDMVQTNPSRLETTNQTIKKYNQALAYCHQDSLDLAVIQLKKVLSLNPNYVRAHQLLALLYIQSEEWERAKRELDKCTRIDTKNITTLRYLKEVDAVLDVEEGAKGSSRKKVVAEDAVKYQSGNETIIQPMNNRENKGVSTVLNIGIGIAIGVAAACFLILPARLKSENSAVQDELRSVSEQLDKKTGTIEEQEQRIKLLTDSNEKLQDELDNYVGNDGTMTVINALLKAVDVYMDSPEDLKAVADALEGVDPEEAAKVESADFKKLYDKLMAEVGPEASGVYYESGMDAYRKELYEEAVADLLKAVEFDETNGDALYNLGNAYRRNEENDKAVEIYKQVLQKFPNTEKARKSQSFLDELDAG